MKFNIKDENYVNSFYIEYMQEGFITVKKVLNKENAMDVFPILSIVDLEQLIEILKEFIDGLGYRVKDETEVKEILQLAVDVRSGNI